MTIEAQARIVVRGGSQALSELQGVTRRTNEAGKATKAAAREQEKAAKEAAKALKSQQVAAERSKRAQTAAAKQQAQAEEREAKKVADYWAAAHRRATDARIREEQRATAVAKREAAKRLEEEKKTLAARDKATRDSMRKGRAIAGGAVLGALAGAGAAANTARSIGGIRSLPERIQAANEFRERLTIVGNDAGLDAGKRDALQGSILSTSKATGTDAGTLLSVLEGGQAQFNDLKFFSDNLQEIATISRASGSDAGEFASALGYIKQAFGLTGEEAMEAAYLMRASSAKGSIEVKNIAKDFASVAGVFAETTKLKGLGGVRQFLGTAQAAGSLGKGSAETATLVERFIASMGQADVVQKMKSKAGIDVKGKTPEEIVDSMLSSKRFQKASVREDIFGKGDVRTEQAIIALMSARQRELAGADGAFGIGTIAKVDAAEGKKLTASAFADVAAGGQFKFDQQNASLQEDTFKNLDSFNSQLLAVNEMSMKLETSFGSLSVWADAIAATGLGAAAGGAMAGGGGDALSSAGHALGYLGKAGAVAGVGLAAYHGAKALGADSWGDSIGNTVADWMFGERPKSEATRGPAPAPSAATRAPVAASQPSAPAGGTTLSLDRQTALIAKQNAILEDIRRNTSTPAPPFRAGDEARRPR